MIAKTLLPAALLPLWLAAPATATSSAPAPARPHQNVAQGPHARHEHESHRTGASEREAHDARDHAKRPALRNGDAEGKNAGKRTEREQDHD